MKKNADVFAWTKDDMPGVDLAIIKHKLNVDPTYKLVKQRKRVNSTEKEEAGVIKCEKLLKAGSIKVVQYPTW